MRKMLLTLPWLTSVRRASETTGVRQKLGTGIGWPCGGWARAQAKHAREAEHQKRPATERQKRQKLWVAW